MRDTVISLKEYHAELQQDRERDRHEQYIIVRRRDTVPLGTIFSYGYSKHDGHVFITCFVERSFLSIGYGVEATALFGPYLMEEYGLYKIYMDVYADNMGSLRSLLRYGFQVEGRFVGHRVVDGKHRDVVRLAAYQETVQRARRFALRLGASEQD